MREICPADPDYEVPDIGVKITNENSAILYFSITVSMCIIIMFLTMFLLQVKKDCPFSHPQYYNSCVGGRCVTDDQGPISSSWSYNEITQLQLSLYERFRVTIAVCTLTKCTNWSQSISKFCSCVVLCYSLKKCVVTNKVLTLENSLVCQHVNLI